jgi:hypothetical protein
MTRTNVRDLGGHRCVLRGGADGQVRQGMIFRGADPKTYAGPSTMPFLATIRTILDLRDDREARGISGECPTAQHDFVDLQLTANSQDLVSIGSRRVRVRVPLVQLSSVAPGLFWECGWVDRGRVVFLLATCRTHEARKLLVKAANHEGLYWFSRIIIEYSGRNLAEALRVLLEATPPVLFHCSLGKDRTGLVSALFLTICGVPREDIIQDYSISASQIAESVHAERLHREADHALKKMGVMGGNFGGSDPEVMEKCLELIDAKGGVRAYLEAHGFSGEMQDKLQDKFTK